MMKRCKESAGVEEGTEIAIDAEVPVTAVESAAEAKSNCPAETIEEA